MYDELIKRIRQVAEEVCEDYDVDPYNAEQRCLAILQAADVIEGLSKPKWIPVTERLPEQKKAHYLCLLDDGSMAVVYWSKVPDWAGKGEWAWHNPNWKEVTHWMPLPEPPKEK